MKSAEQIAKEVYDKKRNGRTGAAISMNVIDLAADTAKIFLEQGISEFASRLKKDAQQANQDSMDLYAIHTIQEVDEIRDELLKEMKG